MAADATTSNYQSVKAQLEKYVYAVDTLDESGSAAKTMLRIEADNILPTLELLFTENQPDQYRTAIISLLHHATKSRELVAKFLVDQLSQSSELGPTANQNQESVWIREAFRLLAQIAPESARQLARKGMATANFFVQAAALQTLGKVGTEADVPVLEAYGAADQTFNVNSRTPRELILDANEIVQRIRERAAH